MEHRKSVRYDLELPARVTVPPGKTALDGWTTDVSNGGAFVRLEEALPRGTPLSLELELGIDSLMRLIGQKNKKVTVSVDGTVVRNNGKGVAVAFGRKYNLLAV